MGGVHPNPASKVETNLQAMLTSASTARPAKWRTWRPTVLSSIQKKPMELWIFPPWNILKRIFVLFCFEVFQKQTDLNLIWKQHIPWVYMECPLCRSWAFLTPLRWSNKHWGSRKPPPQTPGQKFFLMKVGRGWSFTAPSLKETLVDLTCC